MNYIGSKRRLMPFIEETVEGFTHETVEGKVFCDLFAGTGIVGGVFKEKGAKVISNDLQYYSYILSSSLLGVNKDPEFEGLHKEGLKCKEDVFNYLDNIETKAGFITDNYCPGGKDNTEYERTYFTRENGLICDSIREQIEKWYKQEDITEIEYTYLIASLLTSIDKVANTAAVYGSYLKKFKKKAQERLQMREYHKIIEGEEGHKVYNTDANKLIKDIKGDILYMDPPYNGRQYSSNYHILETVALGDSPEIKGKTGIRVDGESSIYCSKVKAAQEFEELIREAQFEFILVSYNDEGNIPVEEIKAIMGRYGSYKEYRMEYQRYKADNKREYTRDKTYESIHCIRKENRV